MNQPSSDYWNCCSEVTSGVNDLDPRCEFQRTDDGRPPINCGNRATLVSDSSGVYLCAHCAKEWSFDDDKPVPLDSKDPILEPAEISMLTRVLREGRRA